MVPVLEHDDLRTGARARGEGGQSKPLDNDNVAHDDDKETGATDVWSSITRAWSRGRGTVTRRWERRRGKEELARGRAREA